MVRKYVGFDRNERTIPAGTRSQFGDTLVFTADDDCTVVGISVEIAIAAEANESGGTTHSAAGYGRLVVNRAGNTVPLIEPTTSWSATDEADTLNDEDAGDTWAISPIAVAGNGAVFVSGAGYTSQNDRIVLAPRTKRKLRRGDQIYVETQYSNGGVGNAVFQEVVTGTIFIEG